MQKIKCISLTLHSTIFQLFVSKALFKQFLNRSAFQTKNKHKHHYKSLLEMMMLDVFLLFVLLNSSQEVVMNKSIAVKIFINKHSLSRQTVIYGYNKI